uniref:Uncharacterized protein n=1 Tax=Eutreptiella gymnastica TaxID=73025 RepID=A0A7S4CFG9_9EUGL
MAASDFAEYLIVEPFDIDTVDARTVAQFVTEMMLDQSVDDDDDESHSELWEWLPQTLGIRSQHPRVYSHIRAILRNVMRDLKQLKAYLASVGLGGKSVKKKEEKGLPESHAVKAEDTITTGVSNASEHIQTVDRLLMDCLRTIHDPSLTHDVRQLLTSAREVLSRDLSGAVDTLRPLVTKGLLRKDAEELAAVRAELQKRDEECKSLSSSSSRRTSLPRAPTSPSPALRQTLQSEYAEMKSNGVVPCNAELNLATIQEQNMLYRELLAEHGRIVREKEQENQRLKHLLLRNGIKPDQPR